MTAPQLGTEPVRLAPVDLAAAFGKPAQAGGVGAGPADRAAGLRGLALARPPAVPHAPRAGHQSEATAEPLSTPPADDEPKKPDEPAATGDPGRAEADDLTTQTIVVYLPLSLRERLRAHHAASKETHTTIILYAVEAAHDQLPALLEAYRPAPREGGLFQHHARPRAQHDEPHVQVSIRPVRADLQVLDRLTTEHRAPNRSALLAAALDHYLPPDASG